MINPLRYLHKKRDYNYETIKELFSLTKYIDDIEQDAGVYVNECNTQQLIVESPKIQSDTIPLDRKKSTYPGQIKVRVFLGTYNAWNSLASLCRAFEEDETIDLALLYDQKYTSYQKVMDLGYPAFDCENYNPEIDEPDIVVISHPYIKTRIPKIREYTKLIVVVLMALIRYSSSTEKFSDLLLRNLEEWHPDYYIADSLIYRHLLEIDWLKGRIVELGNPKYDGIYKAVMSQSDAFVPDTWKKKIYGKRVILWTTDHGLCQKKDQVGTYRISNDLTFDIYSKVFFEYIKTHKSVVIIFRPHPTFLTELEKEKIISPKQIAAFRQWCEKSDGFIFDETDNYDAAYAVMDAVIADAHCGIQCSALPVLKPICLLYRNRKVSDYEPHLVEALYRVYNRGELKRFLDMIEAGKDTMYETRCSAAKEFVKSFDGKNGDTIKTYILDRFREMYQINP